MLLGSAADSAPASASACSCASVDSLTLGYFSTPFLLYLLVITYFILSKLCCCHRSHLIVLAKITWYRWNYKEGQEGMQEDGLVLKRPSEMMQALCPNPVPPPSAAHLMGMNPRQKANLEMAPKCPRCDSSNTKFCYYNNYSLSQPRYFCKTCRRYWTKGGSLRNVPVGGGCRKNKRPKKAPPQHRPLCVNPNPNSNDPNCTTAPTTSTSTSTSNADCDEHQPNPAANFDQMNLSRPLPSMYFSLLNQNQNQQPTDALGALAFSGRSLQIQQPSPYFGMAMAADATMARGLAVDVLSSSSSTDLMPNISTMQSLEGSSPNNNMTVDDEFARRGRIRSCLAQAESPLTPQTATTAARTTPTTAHLNAIYDSVASSTTSTTTANMLHMGDEINDALPLPLSNYIAVNCDAQQQNQHQQQRHQVPINNQRMMSMMMNPLPLLHTLQQQHSQHGGHNSNNINLQHTDGNANDVQSECEKQHKFDSNLGFNSTHFLTNCNTQVPKPDDGESPCNWPVALPCFSTADTFNSNVPWPPEFPSCALPNFSNSVI